MNAHYEPIEQQDIDRKFQEYSKWISGKSLNFDFKPGLPKGSEENEEYLRERGMEEAETKWLTEFVSDLDRVTQDIPAQNVVKEFTIKT